jgi:outer membrane protein TolC
MKIKIKLEYILLVLIAALSAEAKKISLAEYLNAARQTDESAKAADKMKQGAALTKNAASEVTGVYVFSNLYKMNDGRPMTNPMQGDRLLNDAWSVGLQQQTNLGLKWSLSQNFSYTKMENASSAIPLNEFYDSYPKLDLNFSLLRNFLGAETNSSVESIDSKVKIQSLSAETGSIQKENEIIETYYNYLTQKNNFEAQQNSIQRTERILTWTKTRVARNLSDETDLYQIEALLSARKVELISAQARLNEARRLFNKYLKNENEQQDYELTSSQLDTASLSIDYKPLRVRKDLEIQKLSWQSKKADYLAQKEKSKPVLDLQFSGVMQGRDAKLSEAQSRTFRDSKSMWYVGLQFSMPLDVSQSSDLRRGYELLAESSELENLDIEQQKELIWKKTVDLSNQLKDQWDIVKNLVEVQKNKADEERKKFNNGRSTTFQVLSFEQDYISAQNQKNNLEFQIRQFINSLKLYQ